MPSKVSNTILFFSYTADYEKYVLYERKLTNPIIETMLTINI